MDFTTSKKRKRKQPDAATNLTDETIKKSKPRKPRPRTDEVKEQEPEEHEVELEEANGIAENDEDEGMEGVEDEEVVKEGSESGNESSERNATNGDVDADVDANGLLPSNAPLFPPTAASGLFADLNLSEKTTKAIEEMGFSTMTSIQQSVSVI